MNAIILAHKTAATLADVSLKGNKSIEEIKRDLKKHSKEELIEMLAATIKTKKVTVENVARAILEDDACTYLTYVEIATIVATKMGSNTTHKGIADYASKRPDWDVKPRKSAAERAIVMAQLTGAY